MDLLVDRLYASDERVVVEFLVHSQATSPAKLCRKSRIIKQAVDSSRERGRIVRDDGQRFAFVARDEGDTGR
jgi:hypothetical protein